MDGESERENLFLKDSSIRCGGGGGSKARIRSINQITSKTLKEGGGRRGGRESFS